jgi:outer membrane lipoprotein-sorting protein
MRTKATLALLIVLLGGPVHADDRGKAWELLDDLRGRLVADSPIVVDFTQTFTPFGFASGDVESGTVAFDLPDCARWDYFEPFSKSFLLCGNVAYAWNPGETSGRRYEIDQEEQEGLDLLRLDVTELQGRFVAEVETRGEILSVRLDPISNQDLLREATLALSSDALRLVSISYLDREGNSTVFDLGEPRSHDSGGAFVPPPLEWLEN